MTSLDAQQLQKPIGASSGASANGNTAAIRSAVSAAQAGDPQGIHFLYARFAADVQRYVSSIVHDYHEAEDITQNVFAKLTTRISKYEERDVPFAAWIMRVARNAALDFMRASRAVPTEEVRIDDGGRVHMDVGRSRDLRTALEDLPEDQREVMVLRHIAGLTPVEIADALDKTESSVHGLHHRGRRALQTKLVELGAAPVVSSTPAQTA